MTIDTTMVGKVPKSRVITGEDIKPNLAIVGLSSTGQAKYEDVPNSGIGSNGLTNARHDLLSPHYRQYKETFNHFVDRSIQYCGVFRLSDPCGSTGMTIGEAILSPTRTYAPVILKLFKENQEIIKGIIHCSGGGQTKCLNFGQNVHFVKDNMFDIPEIFDIIRDTSNVGMVDMYPVFNMGHRMEVYCDFDDAKQVITTAKTFGIEAKIIGHTTSSKDDDNHVTIHTDEESYVYTRSNVDKTVSVKVCA